MMESIIEASIRRATAANRCAFIPFLTGGFPSPATCVDILSSLADAGADVIEVGLPFSDPLADGPTIQQASQIALKGGVTPETVFDVIAHAGSKVKCPMVLMTYVNPVFRMGVEEFALRAKDSGVAGVIVPDLPPEEADEWLEAANKNNLDTIFLVAPTTPPERKRHIISKTRGFLYYVSMTGVTGSGCTLSDETMNDIHETRNSSHVPVAVGFGISTPEQAKELSGVADGVIVGSAIIREIQAHDSSKDQVDAALRLAASLSKALIRSENPANQEMLHTHKGAL